jgi:hypothetical protein
MQKPLFPVCHESRLSPGVRDVENSRREVRTLVRTEATADFEARPTRAEGEGDARKYLNNEIRTTGDSSVLESYGERVGAFHKYRLELAKELQMEKLYVEAEDLQRKREAWEEQSGELFAVGMEEWTSGMKKLIGMRKRWHDEYEREYVQKASLWQNRCEAMTTLKTRWVNSAAQAAVDTGTVATARQLGLNAETLMAQAEGMLIPRINIETPDLQNITSKVTNGITLTSLIEKARSLSVRSSTDTVLVSAMLPVIRGTSDAMRDLKSFGEEISREVNDHITVARAYQMRDVVLNAEKNIAEQIDDANISVEKNWNR